MRRIAAPLVALLLLAPLASSDAHARTETASYEAPLLGYDAGGLDCARGIGGACFAILPGDRSVRVEVEDASGGPVPLAIEFRDAAGAYVAAAFYCPPAGDGMVPRLVENAGAASEEHDVPAGAALLVVRVPGTVTARLQCHAPAFPTSGTLRATFSDAPAAREIPMTQSVRYQPFVGGGGACAGMGYVTQHQVGWVCVGPYSHAGAFRVPPTARGVDVDVRDATGLVPFGRYSTYVEVEDALIRTQSGTFCGAFSLAFDDPQPTWLFVEPAYVPAADPFIGGDPGCPAAGTAGAIDARFRAA